MPRWTIVNRLAARGPGPPPCGVGTMVAQSRAMPKQVDAVRLMRRGEVEACARVTRLCSSHDPTAREQRYEGMLMCDVRVGVPLVLVLDGRRRLVTSMIQRVDPVGVGVVEVQTSNSRYSVHRLVMPGTRPA